MENKEKIIEKKLFKRKYILATAVLSLLIIAALVFNWFNNEQKPDPASEKIIREAAAAQLNKDPNELTDEDFAKITEINIYRKELTDIKLLEKFTNLQSLEMYDIRFPEKEIPFWMKILAKLGVFDLSKRFSIELSPLKNLTNLQNLNLGSSQISNIEPLKELKNLQSLILSRTNVIDIKPLVNLANLQSLKLTSTQVSDVKPLVNLINLQSLKLGGSKVADIKPLANLTNLELLNLSDTQVNDIKSLANLKKLIFLYLNDTQVSDMSSLTNLKNLRELYIQNCENVNDEQVEDLQKALPNLKIER
ncbi:MAG: hypothetical protein JW787_12135 [Sedimentisphaerales bacterium]|nr:hypothetical protein [Sedimentisphaerales bacterium]